MNYSGRETMQPIKLNLGCGAQAVSGWINVDYALGARLSKLPFFNTLNRKLNLLKLTWDKNICIHDLRKRFPWKDCFADIIYSSHTLEHLSKREGAFFLKECHRVLKRNGLIRIIVPDFSILVARYLNGEVRAEDFATTLVISYESDSDSFLRKKIAPFIRSPHKCMYDKSLLGIVTLVGFEVSSKKPFESDIADIQNIELPERTKDVVIVEGRKA
jgi:predicted SAM-dependent methyltransferase